MLNCLENLIYLRKEQIWSKDSFLPQFVYSIKAAFGCVLFLIFGLMELLAPHCNIIINKLAILCSEKVLKLMNEKIRRTNQV